MGGGVPRPVRKHTPSWRPSVHMFYAAIHSPAAGAPRDCRWVRQISMPLAWITAFLSVHSGNLERRFLLDAYLRRGPKLQITTDASPWGLRAVLTVNDEIVSFFASPITSIDREVLSLGTEA